MLSRRLYWTVSLAVVAAGLTTGAVVAHRILFPQVITTQAAWRVVYQAPREMARGVDAIVVATAAGSQPGRVAFSSNGEDSLNYELVDFDVVHGLKGVQSGDRITLERAVESGAGVFLDADGGRFEEGQTYLLFLTRQGGDSPYFLQINDQGRFRLANDRLHGIDPHDPVVARFHGRTLEDGLAAVRSYLRNRGTQGR